MKYCLNTKNRGFKKIIYTWGKVILKMNPNLYNRCEVRLWVIANIVPGLMGACLMRFSRVDLFTDSFIYSTGINTNCPPKKVLR